MGNLLSFPLLCLQNYIAFRWSVPDTSVPVKINGDDIVFRAPPEVADRWAANVGGLGLTLCVGKTLRDRRFFSLNSSFFRAATKGSNTRLVPVLRSACFGRPVDVPHALGPSLKAFCKGFKGEALIAAQALFLRWRSGLISRTGRSVLRDLRAPVHPDALRQAGLLRREAFLLSCEKAPLPLDRVRLGVSQVPEGWSRVPLRKCGRSGRRASREVEEEFFGLLLEEAWNGDPVPEKRLASETWRLTAGSGHEAAWRWWASRSRGSKARLYAGPFARRLGGLGFFGPGIGYTRFRSLPGRLHLDVRLVYRYQPEPRERKVWAKIGQSGGYRAPVEFVPAT